MSDIPEIGTSEAHDVLEDVGVGFNPTAQHLDLNKDEKRRSQKWGLG